VCNAGAGRGAQWVFDRLVLPLLLRKVYADKNRQEAIIRGSGLRWTIVRPAILNDRPSRGAVRALTDLTRFHGGTVSREDVARFVVDQLASEAWIHGAPLVAW